MLQAAEAIKVVLGAGDSMVGRLLLVDTLAMQFRELPIRKDPACPLCGDRRRIRELIDCGASRAAPAGQELPEPGPARG